MGPKEICLNTSTYMCYYSSKKNEKCLCKDSLILLTQCKLVLVCASISVEAGAMFPISKKMQIGIIALTIVLFVWNHSISCFYLILFFPAKLVSQIQHQCPKFTDAFTIMGHQDNKLYKCCLKYFQLAPLPVRL
jgi:hypothetical protein